MTARALRLWLTWWGGLTLVLCVIVWWTSRAAPGDVPSDEAGRWALDALERSRLGEAVAEPPAAAREYHAPEAILVDAWYVGRRVARYAGSGDLASTVHEAAGAFAKNEALHAVAGWTARADAPRRVRFTITIVQGRALVWTGIPWLEDLALVPMRSGLLLDVGDRTSWLTPDDLRARGAFEGAVDTPLDDVRIGADLGPLQEALAVELGMSVASAREGGRFRSFRATTIAAGAYPAKHAVSAEALERAAREGAEFLLRFQLRSGRFTYEYDAKRGSRAIRGYSLARHAGTAFFLAEFHRLHGMPTAQEGARTAIRWEMREHLRACGEDGARCVVDRDQGRVGDTALFAIAVAELLTTESNPTMRDALRDMAAFLRQQQRPDGELMHGYDVAAGEPIDSQGLYASGQAALALTRAHRLLGDARDLEAAHRILDYLAGPGWGFLGSRYYFGEEHWTCLAANELDGLADVSAARGLCRRWAQYNRRMQLGEGETSWDARGAYSVGPVVPPQFTPASSRTEAFISTYLMERRRGHEDAALRSQIEAGLGLLLGWRWAPGPEHLLSNPANARGGMPGNPAGLIARNDYVQHACSAMSRWAKVLEGGNPGWAVDAR